MKYNRQFIFIFVVVLGVSAKGFTQGTPGLQVADSLYLKKEWASAKMKYANYLGDTSRNSMIWNRLGFCNQNLGNYSDALVDYNHALSYNPSVPVKSSAMSRMAMVYSLTNKPDESADWLMKAAATGYSNLQDLDTLTAFHNLRSSSKFKELRKKVYELIYPCSNEPRNRDFDFWVGDWVCYQTGTQNFSGTSHVEVMAGGCAILENYTSSQAYSGKSFNFYDTVGGKWIQDWIGSGGASDRQHYYDGEFKDGKMHFVYDTTNPNGEKTKGNFIFYFVSADTVRQYQDITDKTGKTLSVVYDLTYIRKK